MKFRKRLLLKSLDKSPGDLKLKNKLGLKKDVETVLKLNIKDYPSLEDLESTNLSRNKKKNFFVNNEQSNAKDQTEEALNTLAISIRKLKTYYPNIKDEVFNENYTNGQIPSRTEHINFEENLKAKIKALTQKETELKKNKENLENDIKQLDNLIEDEQMNIEAINNVDSDLPKKQKILTEKIINDMNINLKSPGKEKDKNRKNMVINSKEFKEQLDLLLLREDYNKNQKIKEIKESIENKTITKYQKIKELNELNETLKKNHDDKKKEIEDLYMHYLNILKEGKDTRNEGLSWIIREIFSLDKKVMVSFFPKFLDKLCIKYLFNITHINMNITEIEKKIKICKKDFKDKGIVKEIENNQNKDFLTERNLATRENLNKLKMEFSQSFQKKFSKKNNSTQKGLLLPLYDPPRKISIFLNNISSSSTNNNTIYTTTNNSNATNKKKSLLKIIENIDEKKDDNNLPYINGDPNNFMKGKDQNINYTNKLIKDEMQSSIKIPPIIRLKDFDKMSFIKNLFTSNEIVKVNNFFNLRRKLSKLREEKDLLKTKEMDRIFKEFQKNNYSQKYNVDKIKVISALIGEDNINNEIFRQERRERLYFDQISKSQLYNKNSNYQAKALKEKKNNN